MRLESTVNSCNVCQVLGNRKYMISSTENGTLFIVPFSVSDDEIELIANYGTVLRETFCERGDVDVCFTYVSFYIQSKAIKNLVCTKQYAKRFFNDEIESNGIYSFNGMKLIVSEKFLSQGVKNEIYGK